jgi:hypothetical protein
MTGSAASLALWIAIAWPLLLAFPALRRRLPAPRILAILPAALVTVSTGDVASQLPYVLFGTGISIDHNVRWVFGMLVVVWSVATVVAASSGVSVERDRETTFALIVLGGSLGSVLAADLLSFFSFSTAMAYSFYALLVSRGDADLRSVGRLYLGCVVVADLALFDALILAAFSTRDFQFEGVRLAMAGSASVEFYSWLVLSAFVLKAGLWPAHRWVCNAYALAPRSSAILLGAAPVSIGLLGAVRWLPPGEDDFTRTAAVISAMGIIAVVRALYRFRACSSMRAASASAAVLVSGLFLVGIGWTFAQLTSWSALENTLYPSIAAYGMLLALLAMAHGRSSALEPQRISLGPIVIEARNRMAAIAMFLRDSVVARLNASVHAARIGTAWRQLQEFERLGFGLADRGWTTAITVFVLLGLAIGWLAR